MSLPSFAAGLAIAAGALTFGGAIGGLASLDSELASAAAATPESRSRAVFYAADVRDARDANCRAREDGAAATRRREL